MSVTLPNCDGCGKFTANGVEIETAKADFWNGPDVTFYCSRCLNIAPIGMVHRLSSRTRGGSQLALVAEESVSRRTRGRRTNERGRADRVRPIGPRPRRLDADVPRAPEGNVGRWTLLAGAQAWHLPSLALVADA